MLTFDQKAQHVSVSARHLQQSELESNMYIHRVNSDMDALLHSRVTAVQHRMAPQGISTIQKIQATGVSWQDYGKYVKELFI
jgi:hypothetical protein